MVPAAVRARVPTGAVSPVRAAAVRAALAARAGRRAPPGPSRAPGPSRWRSLPRVDRRLLALVAAALALAAAVAVAVAWRGGPTVSTPFLSYTAPAGWTADPADAGAPLDAPALIGTVRGAGYDCAGSTTSAGTPPRRSCPPTRPPARGRPTAPSASPAGSPRRRTRLPAACLRR